MGERELQAARGSSCQPVCKESEMSPWPFWLVGRMPGQGAAQRTQLGEGCWSCPFHWSHPPSMELNPTSSLAGAACVGAGTTLILIENACFAEPWDAATCLPWSFHVGLGAGTDPCSTAPGWGDLPPRFPGWSWFCFSQPGRTWCGQRALPFSAGPLQREVVFFFFLSVSSASLFQLSFRMRFV